MYPILFKVGELNLYSYAVFAFLAIFFGSFLLKYRFKKENFKINLFDFLFWTILSGAIGAKIVYIVLYPSEFSFSIFYSGGAVSWGGIIFALIAAFVYAKKNQLDFVKILDIGFVCLLFGLAFGRFGSFLNGNGFGKITSSWYGIVIPVVDNVKRFPAEIFEATLLLITIACFLAFENRKYFKKPGKRFIILLLLYNLIRFITDFFKDGFVRFWHLTINQYFVLLLIILILLFIIIKNSIQVFRESNFRRSNER